MITNELDKLSRNDVLMMWERTKSALEIAKTNEMDMRKYVVSRAFPTPKEGVNTLDLGNGYKLKASVKFNYNLKDNTTVENTLKRISQIGNIGPMIVDKLVKIEYSFLLTEFRILETEASFGSIDAQAILKEVHSMLNVTEAAPTLEIKEPRVKK